MQFSNIFWMSETASLPCVHDLWWCAIYMVSLQKISLIHVCPERQRFPRKRSCHCFGLGGFRGCETGHCFHWLFSLFLSFSTSIAFHPIRENSRGWHFVSTNILAKLEGIYIFSEACLLTSSFTVSAMFGVCNKITPCYWLRHKILSNINQLQPS